MPFYGVFLKKWQLQIPLMLSLYVQIFFALLYHLPFIAYFGLDSINSQNAASVMYASIFPSLVAPLLWMLAITHLAESNQYFHELDAGLYRSDCLCLVERGVDGFIIQSVEWSLSVVFYWHSVKQL